MRCVCDQTAEPELCVRRWINTSAQLSTLMFPHSSCFSRDLSDVSFLTPPSAAEQEFMKTWETTDATGRDRRSALGRRKTSSHQFESEMFKLCEFS